MLQSNTISLDDLLSQFMANPEERAQLASPHYEDGYVIASDGHKLIKAPDKYFDVIPQPFDRFPKWKNIVPDYNGTVGIIPCKKILGTISMMPKYDFYKDCWQCDGGGRVECNYGHTHKCDECRGSGKDSELVGKRIDINKDVVGINDAIYNHALWLDVVKVANILKETNIIIHHVSTTRATVCYVADIMFLIMPLSMEALKSLGYNPAIHKLTIE